MREAMALKDNAERTILPAPARRARAGEPTAPVTGDLMLNSPFPAGPEKEPCAFMKKIAITAMSSAPKKNVSQGVTLLLFSPLSLVTYAFHGIRPWLCSMRFPLETRAFSDRSGCASAEQERKRKVATCDGNYFANASIALASAMSFSVSRPASCVESVTSTVR